MNHFQRVFLIFGLVASTFGIVFTYKTDTWPPKEMLEATEEICPMVNTTQICHDSCKVNLDEVRNFEMTTDFARLPRSRELKCYMFCFMVACKVFKENSNPLRLNTVFLLEQIEKFPREQQDILFGMGRGCMRRIINLKDPFEIAYQMNVCSKENDNEHYFFYY